MKEKGIEKKKERDLKICIAEHCSAHASRLLFGI
jgi:hypothetical protein